MLEDLGNLAANELFSGTDMDPEGAFLRIRNGLQAVRDRSEHLVVISNDLHRDGETYPRETECYLDLMARLHRELARLGGPGGGGGVRAAGDLEGGEGLNILRTVGMAFALYLPHPHAPPGLGE